MARPQEAASGAGRLVVMRGGGGLAIGRITDSGVERIWGNAVVEIDGYLLDSARAKALVVRVAGRRNVGAIHPRDIGGMMLALG